MLSLADDPYNVLREIDEVSSRVGDVDLSRFWPLAMVMAQRLDSWRSYRSHCRGIGFREPAILGRAGGPLLDHVGRGRPAYG